MNLGSASATNQVKSLGFTNLVSSTSLSTLLKKIVTKDRLKIGDISKEPNQIGLDISIPIEQAVQGMVSRLESGEQSLETGMVNTVEANLS